MIRHVAAGARAPRASADSVARIGGDEFAVLLAETRGAEALRAAEQLCRGGRREPVRLGAARDRASRSAPGSCEISGATVDEEAAFARADAALYAAKAAGRGRVSVAS